MRRNVYSVNIIISHNDTRVRNLYVDKNAFIHVVGFLPGCTIKITTYCTGPILCAACTRALYLYYKMSTALPISIGLLLVVCKALLVMKCNAIVTFKASDNVMLVSLKKTIVSVGYAHTYYVTSWSHLFTRIFLRQVY